jgi:iron complex outermembrane recepter protein
VFYRNIQQDGTATLEILSNPHHANRSTSGEARVTGVFTQDTWRHTVHMGVRGRQTYRLFGGSDTVSYGPVKLGEYIPRPEPSFHYGVRDTDDVTQIMPGVSYVGQWAGVGEVSVGLQKAFYDRAFGKENAVTTSARSRPWLYNGTLAYYATPDLAFYAGYTRGLEEFGTAPENALNRGQPMPAAVTKQFDAGLRYRIAPGLSFVAGVFEVTKPYFDRDTTNLYTVVGGLSHRGIELSFTGRLMPGLNVVAGAMLLKPRVSGLSVDRGLIAKVPAGTPTYALALNVQYGPASWRGFAIDAAVDSEGSKYANRLNTLELPGYSTLALGARYSFALWGGNRASVRAQVLNAFDADAWLVEGSSGRYSRPNPRGYLLRLAADF